MLKRWRRDFVPTGMVLSRQFLLLRIVAYVASSGLALAVLALPCSAHRQFGGLAVETSKRPTFSQLIGRETSPSALSHGKWGVQAMAGKGDMPLWSPWT